MFNELHLPEGSENDGLAEQLRRGAVQERPAFSEELHSRIMLAIRNAEPRPASLAGAEIAPAVAAVASEPSAAWNSTRSRVSGSTGSDWRHSKILSWAAMAAALLVMAVGGWRLSTVVPANVGPQSSQVAANDVPSIPSSDGTYTWADLDHDARLTAQLVVDQMPIEAPYEDLNFGNQQ
jgi:hypothetical protein